MNLLRVSAVSILLVGLPAAGTNAQDATALSGAQEPERELEPGWASDIERGSSTIMAQANAVFAALRADQGAPDPSALISETIEVADLEAERGVIRNGNGSEGCIFMETPGSRIRRWRCYYPSDGEEALNEYQFSEEIRLMRQQQAQMEMARQLLEARAASGQ